MINLKEIRKDIKSIEVGDDLYCKTITNVLYGEDSNLIDLKDIIDFRIYSWNGKVYLSENESNRLYQVIAGKLIKSNYSGTAIYEIAENKCIVFSNENNNYKVNFYYKEELKLSIVGFGFSATFNSSYYAFKPKYKSSFIHVRSFDEASYLFKFNFGNDYFVGSLIRLINNTLIVPFKRQGNQNEIVFIGLNLVTKSKLWNIESDVDQFLTCDKKGMLYSIYSSSIDQKIYLQNIDINNGSKVKYTIKENCHSDVMPWLAILHENILIYIDNSNGTRLVLLDLTSRVILNEIELNLDEGVLLDKPKVYDGNIYILDTLRNLYIFNNLLNM